MLRSMLHAIFNGLHYVFAFVAGAIAYLYYVTTTGRDYVLDAVCWVTNFFITGDVRDIASQYITWLIYAAIIVSFAFWLAANSVKRSAESSRIAVNAKGK